MRRRIHLGARALYIAAFLCWAGLPAARAGDGPGGDPGGMIDEDGPTKPSEKESPEQATPEVKPRKPDQAVKPILRPNEDATVRDPKTGDPGIAVPPETVEDKGKR